MSDNFPTLLRIHELLRYDPETGKLFWRVANSRRIKVGSEAGSISKAGYRSLMIDGYRFLAHRVIFFMQNGEWPKQVIDHMDGDRLNNRLSNLRECSIQTNNENRRSLLSKNATGFLGVHPAGKRFVAKIRVSGMQKHIGNFDTVEEAQSAYLAAKSKLHKGFVG